MSRKLLLKKHDRGSALLHKGELIKTCQTQQTVGFAAKFKVNSMKKIGSRVEEIPKVCTICGLIKLFYFLVYYTIAKHGETRTCKEN